MTKAQYTNDFSCHVAAKGEVIYVLFVLVGSSSSALHIFAPSDLNRL
jgi:hypothetical protein